MDVKGRVFVPARWREELRSGVVLAQGLEHCIYVYPSHRFEELSQRLEELPVNRKTNRDYSRLVLGTASEEQLDKQGRISIPPVLREWARLDKEAVVVGVRNRAEIWDRDAWDTYKSSVESDYESIAEALEI